MGSIIRSTGTVFYSLLYVNSRQGFDGLKYVYSVISVIVDSLPGNTKNWESTRSWTARVRLFHPWADPLFPQTMHQPNTVYCIKGVSTQNICGKRGCQRICIEGVSTKYICITYIVWIPYIIYV